MEAPENIAALKDGTKIRLGSIGVCDKQCIMSAFENLSGRSRYTRYHAPIGKLPDSYLESLLQADNLNSVVIVAYVADNDPLRGAGLARYVRLADEPGVAECSITIADDFQGKGLGALLLDYLVRHARLNKLSTLRGYVLSGNRPMIKLFERYDHSVQAEGDGTLRYDIDTTSL